MCGTARIFCLKHNTYIKNTSTMLNHGRSAASAHHLRLLPSHFFIASVVKKNPRSLELLIFKKSEIAVTHIQSLIYCSTLVQTKASQSKSFRDQAELNVFDWLKD